MKRLGTVTLVILMVLCLALASGCAGSKPKTETETDNGTTTKDSILIGIPNPTTGPLADFGAGTPWTEQQIADYVNKDGGIYIKELDKKLPVKFIVYDTESNPTKASEMAQKMILEDKVDILIARHTPDTINPVTAIAERYQVPCVAMDCPIDAWLPGGPYEWSFLSFFTVDQVYQAWAATWKDMGLEGSTIGFLFPSDADGTVWAPMFTEKLTAAGYKVVDPGRYAVGTNDYSAIINKFKAEGVTIVTGTDVPPDFASFWKQSKQLGFDPKCVLVGKAYHFNSSALALGPDLANGLMSEVWWSPSHPFVSALTGETPKTICDKFTADLKKPWTAPIGYKYAGMEIAIDALVRAQSLDKTAIRDALKATDLMTVIGPIKFNDQSYSEAGLVVGQWVKDGDDAVKINVVNSALHPEIPVTAEPFLLK